MAKYLTLFLCMGLLCSMATAQGPSGDQKSGKDVEAVVQGGNVFALDLYARLTATEKGNLFFSPSSIHTALAMTYAGAAGNTAEEMARTLHYTLPKEQLAPAFGGLLKRLNEPRKNHEGKLAYQLSVSNALWPAKAYPFKPAFVDLVKKEYGATLEELDYEGKTEESRKAINDTIAKQTRDKIKDLIPQGEIKPDTRLVLTNAVYFKSNWASQFTKEMTKSKPFRVSADKKVDAPMMVQQEHFAYMENDELQMLEMPYDMNGLAMLILLPRKVDGLAALEKGLSSKALEEWRAKLAAREVRVSLPRFKFTAQFSLKDALVSLGMTDAFSDRANFSGMTTAEQLFISAVLHKAFVAVDEDGTEAAAATAVLMRPTAAPMPQEPKIFNADHPFLFLIRHNATGAILFLGRVTEPQGGTAAPAKGARDAPSPKSTPILRLEGISPKPDALRSSSWSKPIMVRSAKEAAEQFPEEDLAKLTQQVDFAERVVLVFAWRGSGGDRLEYAVAESYPEQVFFTYRPGRTRDLVQHVRVYSLRSNVSWNPPRGGARTTTPASPDTPVESPAPPNPRNR